MCRSLKVLRGPEPVPPDEVEAAALQFVRKISGYRKPAKKNEEPFDAAVREIADASKRLLANLGQTPRKPSPPEAVSSPAEAQLSGTSPD